MAAENIEQLKQKLEEKGVDTSNMTADEIKEAAKPTLKDALLGAGKEILKTPYYLLSAMSQAGDKMSKSAEGKKPDDLKTAVLKKPEDAKSEQIVNTELEPTKKENVLGIKETLTEKPKTEPAAPDLAGVVKSKPLEKDTIPKPGSLQTDKKEIATASTTALSPDTKLLVKAKTDDSVPTDNDIMKMDAPKLFIEGLKANREYIAKDPAFVDIQDKYYKAKDEALKQKQDAEARMAWLELASVIGKSLVQYSAGKYGQKHGVNMAGLEFDKVDWDKKLAQRMAMIDDQTSVLEEKYKAAQAENKDKLGLMDKATELSYADLTAKQKAAMDAKAKQEELALKATEQGKGRDFEREMFQKKAEHDKEMYGTKEEQKKSERNIKQEDSLRQEWEKSPVTKNTQIAYTGYRKMKEATASGAGDMALIYGYMKLLDPTSTVRESEYATAEKAAGVPERIRQMYNKIVDGEKLSPAMRQDFLKNADKQLKVHLDSQAKVDKQLKAVAEKRGLDVNNIIDPTMFDIDAAAGNEPTATKSAGGSDKKVQDYADQYFKGDYNKALNLLKTRGYKASE